MPDHQVQQGVREIRLGSQIIFHDRHGLFKTFALYVTHKVGDNLELGRLTSFRRWGSLWWRSF